MKMYKFNGGKTSKGKIVIYHLLFNDELSAKNMEMKQICNF